MNINVRLNDVATCNEITTYPDGEYTYIQAETKKTLNLRLGKMLNTGDTMWYIDITVATCNKCYESKNWNNGSQYVSIDIHHLTCTQYPYKVNDDDYIVKPCVLHNYVHGGFVNTDDFSFAIGTYEFDCYGEHITITIEE